MRALLALFLLLFLTPSLQATELRLGTNPSPNLGRRGTLLLASLQEDFWGGHAGQVTTPNSSYTIIGVDLLQRTPCDPYVQGIFGISYWSAKTERMGQNWEFHLGARYGWKAVYIGFEHWSSGKAFLHTPGPNGGEDWFTIGLVLPLR